MKNRILLAILLIFGSVMCATAELPQTFDWRDVNETNYVTPVKNQGGCGACYAFGTVAGLEMFASTNKGQQLDLSEEQAKECGGNGCSGGVPDYVLGLFSIVGSVSEESDPYHAYTTSCNSSTTPEIRVTEWRELSYGSMDEIKEYIYDYGHVITTVSSGHIGILVGWNDTTEQWVYKNSYGTGWGDDGFGYRDYGTYTENHVKAITGYEPHDDDVWTLTHAKKANYGLGYHPNNTAWGLSLLEVDAGEGITKIEFDTTGSTTDIDLYIYDGFNGTHLGNLLYQVSDLNYDVAGFYTVHLDSRLVMDTMTEVAVVGKFVNSGTQVNLNGYKPVATEIMGTDSGKTYGSQTGTSGTWTPAENFAPGGDVTLRLRITDDPTEISSVSKRREILTIRGSGFGEEDDWGNLTITSGGTIIEHDIVSWDDSRILAYCQQAGSGDTVTLANLHGSDSETCS